MPLPIDQQNIIGILGIASLPDEEKVSIINKVTTLVEKRLLVRIFDSLDKLRQNEFSELLEEGNQDKISEFLNRSVPGIGQMMEGEVAAVKQELTDWAAQI